jgi:putative ABC transport system substrate-binding protein
LARHAERTYRICWLTPAALGEPYNIAFEQRLRELGFVEGRNLVIEFRTAEGRLEGLPELAADLARQNCDTLLASGSEATFVAIKQAILDAPIVAVAINDDLAVTGHITILSRPGGRITGVSQQQMDLPQSPLSCSKSCYREPRESPCSRIPLLEANSRRCRLPQSGSASR